MNAFNSKFALCQADAANAELSHASMDRWQVIILLTCSAREWANHVGVFSARVGTGHCSTRSADRAMTHERSMGSRLEPAARRHTKGLSSLASAPVALVLLNTRASVCSNGPVCFSPNCRSPAPLNTRVFAARTPCHLAMSCALLNKLLCSGSITSARNLAVLTREADMAGAHQAIHAFHAVASNVCFCDVSEGMLLWWRGSSKASGGRIRIQISRMPLLCPPWQEPIQHQHPLSLCV